MPLFLSVFLYTLISLFTFGGAAFLLIEQLGLTFPIPGELISPLAEDSKKLGGKEPAFYLDLANHDLSAYQKRVNGECSSGQAVRVISEEGEVTCEAVSSQQPVANSGGSSDADTLDSLDSSQFLRSDASDSFTSGTLTLISPTTLSVQGNLSLPTGSVTGTFIADGTITNADVSSSAAIAYSKLSLANSILSSDIADGTITGADLASNISISTSGNLTTSGSGALSIAGSSTLAGTTLGNSTSTTGSFTSTVSDSSSAVGFTLTTSSLTTAGAKLISIKNGSTEELSIDKDGNLTLNGNLVSTGTLQGTQLISTIGDGTPPLVVISQTQVANLNASLLGGFSAAQLTGNLYNYLTNPGFEIWQRGTGPFSGDGVFTADMWVININNASTFAVTQESTIIPTDSRYSLKAVYTHVASGLSYIETRVLKDADIIRS